MTVSVPVLTLTAEMTEAAARAIAEQLRSTHWDGNGCGTNGAGGCSRCYGPSPADAYEIGEDVAEVALAAALPLIVAAVRANERAKGETTVGHEYRSYEKLPFADADHAKHPDRPHRCRCACDEFVSPWCPEHGEQVARERREVRTMRSFGDWERYEWPGRGAARDTGSEA